MKIHLIHLLIDRMYYLLLRHTVPSSLSIILNCAVVSCPPEAICEIAVASIFDTFIIIIAHIPYVLSVA